MNYLLRVEGVNHINIIDDTDQLSVRRGGGLMLLNAVVDLKESLPPGIGDRLEVVATGASIGMYEFRADSPDEAAQVRDAVERHYQAGELRYSRTGRGEARLPLKHGTFVVDVVPINSATDAEQAVESAIAANRWRQMQEPTLSLDGLWEPGSEPCAVDRTRVAQVKMDLHSDAKGSVVSRTSADRWKYGQDSRQRFYQRELEEPAKESREFAEFLGHARFTDDLQALSARPALKSDDGRSNKPDPLADKLAVFYVDGNGFSEIGRTMLRSGTNAFRHWSEAVRSHHRSLLKELVEHASHDPDWKTGDRIRLETLLWGGDEILWVVPAWKGWEVARWFFSQAHSVQVEGQTIPLTYGCGLVFCHAKAPIKNITALARGLGDLAKESRAGENAHRLAYEVLESYDDISGDLTAHRRRFLPQNESVTSLIINPGELFSKNSDGASAWDILQAVADCSDFPTRQLYMLTKAWRDGDQSAREASENRIRRVLSDSKIDVDRLLHRLGNPQGWLHLLQMLPYVESTCSLKDGGAA